MTSRFTGTVEIQERAVEKMIHRLGTYGRWAFAITGLCARNSLLDPVRNQIAIKSIFQALAKNISVRTVLEQLSASCC